MTEAIRFSAGNISVDLNVTECFRPNLTTTLLVEAVIQHLKIEGGQCRSILEIGCGSGAITSTLIAGGHLSRCDRVSLSDVSEAAVETARYNIRAAVANDSSITTKFHVGAGLNPWAGEKFDLIINDVSAVSSKVASVSPWFEFAPCNTGEDGLDNTLDIIERSVSHLNSGGWLIFPVLSLSNERLLFEWMAKRDLKPISINSREWPLPLEMADQGEGVLNELKERGIITVERRFGRFLARTSCYKLSF